MHPISRSFANPSDYVYEGDRVIPTFVFLRQIYFWIYFLGAVYLTYEYIKSQKKKKKVFVRSLFIVGIGTLISQFTLFFALFTQNLISRFFNFLKRLAIKCTTFSAALC